MFSYAQKLILNSVIHHANWCCKCHFSDQPTLACLSIERNIEKGIENTFSLKFYFPIDFTNRNTHCITWRLSRAVNLWSCSHLKVKALPIRVHLKSIVKWMNTMSKVYLVICNWWVNVISLWRDFLLFLSWFSYKKCCQFLKNGVEWQQTSVGNNYIKCFCSYQHGRWTQFMRHWIIKSITALIF